MNINHSSLFWIDVNRLENTVLSAPTADDQSLYQDSKMTSAVNTTE
jgi:hypothetical protein